VSGCIVAEFESSSELRGVITNATQLIEFLGRYHRSILEREPAKPVTWPEFVVPEPLRALHELFGQHIDHSWGPLSSQDHLAPLHEMRLDGDEVVFLHENQGCWSCTYSLTPPHPVFRYDDEPTGTRQTDTLEEFLITFALQEAVMSSPWLLGIHGAPSAEALGIELVDLHRGGRYAYEGENDDFWITPDQQTICMDNAGTALWLASYSDRVLDLRRPEFEYQIVSPRDPLAPKTYGGRDENGKLPQSAPSFFQRFAAWLRSLKR
jgi:hypothetical protein